MTRPAACAGRLPWRQHWRRDVGAAGFTLIEVMLGLTLMALVATLVLPGLRRPAGPATLRATAYQVSALLRDARTAAINAGRPTSAVVDNAAGAIEAAGRRLALPSGIRIAAGVAGRPAIRFAPDGTATGGTVLLATATTRLAVSVEPDTGAIILAP